MMGNILTFTRPSTSRPIARQYAAIPDEDRYARPRRFAKNPLRQHLTTLSLAIVAANKVDEFIDSEALNYIRKGVDAAHILADELAGLAERLGGQSHEQ